MKKKVGIEMAAHYLDLLVAYGTKIAAALAILVAGAILARIANRVIKESFIRANVDVTVGKFLRRGAKYAIYAFAIITALSTMGMNIQPIIAGIGITGFIIGFAVKDTLSNLAAGMLLIFYRPFGVGDEISAAKVRGTVREINIIATIIETQEGDMITVPNSKVWGAPITNYSAKSSR